MQSHSLTGITPFVRFGCELAANQRGFERSFEWGARENRYPSRRLP